jgi:hypothetical protein
METGGMKGRRKRTHSEELHEILCEGFFGVSIHSEYGMTRIIILKLILLETGF